MDFVPVDRLLNPANRNHMSKEEQLNKLLEMLDLTTAMKSSPSRSKRLKLLKKAISDVRMEMGHKMEPLSLEQNNPKEEEKAPLILPLATEEEGAVLLNQVGIFVLAYSNWNHLI